MAIVRPEHQAFLPARFLHETWCERERIRASSAVGLMAGAFADGCVTGFLTRYPFCARALSNGEYSSTGGGGRPSSSDAVVTSFEPASIVPEFLNRAGGG